MTASLHFTNLQLYSPKLRLAGAGQRRRDGTFHIVASGRRTPSVRSNWISR